MRLLQPDHAGRERSRLGEIRSHLIRFVRLHASTYLVINVVRLGINYFTENTTALSAF